MAAKILPGLSSSHLKDRQRIKQLKAQMNELDRRECENFLSICELLRVEAMTQRSALSEISDSSSSSSWFTDPTDLTSTETDEQRYCALYDRLQAYIEQAVEPLSVRLFAVVAKFDLEGTRASGYRSLLLIVKRCCSRLLTDARHIRHNRNTLSIRPGHAFREFQAFVDCLGELRWCLHYSCALAEISAQSGSLFLEEKFIDRPDVQRLIYESEMIDQSCFYGRCLGFQYIESLQRPLQGVVTGMAAYSVDFSADSDSGMFKKLVSMFRNAPKYMFYKEKRGEQIVNMTRHADIEFCKSFWNIAETPFLQNIPMLVCPPVEISDLFELPATAFSVPSRDPEMPEQILIQPPIAHTGPGPVTVRLISYRQREGQGWLREGGSRSKTPPSRHLLVHCHGGGFVAQSSRSHEVYLRHWAKQLDCPILSIDYSLAPEQPFPRALEESFFAYCWALKNCRRLGSTGESIVVAGDSAGGNLMISLCLRAIEFGVRLPDGILAAYTPVLARPVPSPSRILSMMDPLLPVGILLRCLLAYSGISESSLPHHRPPAAFRSGLSSSNSPDEENVIFNADHMDSPTSPPCSPCSLESLEDGAFEDERADPLESLYAQRVANDAAEAGATSRLSERQALELARLELNGANGGPGLNRSSTWHDFSGSTGPGLRWTTELARRHFTANPNGAESPLYRMQHAPVPKDPYMSPYLAEDEVLRQLPPLTLVACNLDPLLDDCVEFAKRMTRLKRQVTLRVLEDLPHGFLNFALLSKDAMRGSDECVRLILEMLDRACPAAAKDDIPEESS